MPAELRGAGRDDVALMVAERARGRIEHGRFGDLPSLLRAGDLLVVNTSATLAAALPALLDGQPVELHLSTPVSGSCWVVELRTADRLPFPRPRVGARLALPRGAYADLVAPYLGSSRLVLARLTLGEPLDAYLERHGRPIRYDHAGRGRPIGDYQTAFALHPGSAEMPSAARPFTPELVTELVAHGILVAPLTLHAGVSSLEAGEAPYPERYDLPASSARLVEHVHASGGRVIAVGTTVVRALESAARDHGLLTPGAGVTDLVVTPESGVHVVDGLLTGWHEPESSHLLMLEAIAGRDLLERSYRAARARGYLFHEFGDSHLILR